MLSFMLFVLQLGEFTWQFAHNGLETSRTPAVGPVQTRTLGVVIFSYGFVVMIPSWCNEKLDKDRVNRAVWVTNSVCTAAFIGFGLFGAWAWDGIPSSNLLSFMVSTAADSSIVTQVSVYFFTILVIGLSVPMYSIIVRYNLYVGEVLGKFWSAVWGVVFPWLLAFFFYQGAGFTFFVNWSSLFLNGFVNFVVPFIVWLIAKRRYQQGNITTAASPVVHAPPLAPTPGGGGGVVGGGRATAINWANRSSSQDPPEPWIPHRALPARLDRPLLWKLLPLALSILLTVMILTNIVADIFELATGKVSSIIG